MNLVRLHIGLHKTGTTSVQNVMFRNRKKILKNYGIDYVPYGIPKQAGHANLAWELKNNASFKPGSGTWHDVLAHIEATRDDGRTYVLSAEAFSLLTDAEIAQVADHLAPFDVQIVVTLRNQLDLALSSYKANMKRGLVPSFDEWLRRCLGSRQFQFATLIERWQQRVQPIEMVVKPYETQRHALTSSLLTVFGVPDTAAKRLSHGSTVKNPSPSLSYLYAYQDVLRRFEADPARQAFVRKHQSSALRYAETKGYCFFDGVPTTPETAENFMNAFHDENRAVSKDFVDLPDKYFRLPDFTPYRPDNGPDAEEILAEVARPRPIRVLRRMAAKHLG